MNEAEVRARLITFADVNTEPVLTSADIEVVLDTSKRVDKFGVWPSQEGWTGTFDVNYAIAQCWLLKATRLANRYLFMSGGKMFSRNQFYEHCMDLHRKFLSKADMKALRLATGKTTNLDQIPANWNSADVLHN